MAFYNRKLHRLSVGGSRVATSLAPKTPLLPPRKRIVFSLGTLRGSALPVIRLLKNREKRMVAWGIIYALKKEAQKAKSYSELTSQVNAFIRRHPRIMQHSEPISSTSVAKMHRLLIKNGLIVQ